MCVCVCVCWRLTSSVIATGESAKDGTEGEQQVVVVEHSDEARGDAGEDRCSVVKNDTVNPWMVG